MAAPARAAMARIVCEDCERTPSLHLCSSLGFVPTSCLQEEPKSSEVVGKEPVTHENVKESPAAQAPAPTLAANSKTDARAETDGPVENEGRSAADAQAEAKDIFSDPVELPAVELGEPPGGRVGNAAVGLCVGVGPRRSIPIKSKEFARCSRRGCLSSGSFLHTYSSS